MIIYNKAACKPVWLQKCTGQIYAFILHLTTCIFTAYYVTYIINVTHVVVYIMQHTCISNMNYLFMLREIYHQYILHYLNWHSSLHTKLF